MTWSAPIRKQLSLLPRTSATWQLGTAQAELVMQRNGVGVMCLCVQSDGMVRASTVTSGPPTADDWATLVRKAIATPIAPSRPMRPGRVQVADAVLAAQIAPFLAPLQVTVETVAELATLAEFAAALAGDMAEGGRVVVGDLEPALFAAAADYARAEPWLAFDSEPEFTISTDVPGWPTPIAVVMGGMGQTFGLSVFRNAQAYDEICQAHARGDREASASVDAVTVSLVSSREMPAVERKRAAARRYEVVPGRFPLFTRTAPGRKPSDLHAPDHYRALTAAVRAVTGWLAAVGEGTVDVAAQVVLDGGKLAIRLDNPFAYALGSDVDGAESEGADDTPDR